MADNTGIDLDSIDLDEVHDEVLDNTGIDLDEIDLGSIDLDEIDLDEIHDVVLDNTGIDLDEIDLEEILNVAAPVDYSVRDGKIVDELHNYFSEN